MADTPGVMRRVRSLAASVAIILFGYLLRAYDIGQQALRGDEAFNVGFAQLPLAEMLQGMAHGEPHPPLQFLYLKVWMQLVGDSEPAVRWPAVLAGVILIALTARIGRAWLGPAAGRAGALLAAFSPFLIWYSQDGRIYPPLAALVLGGAYLTWRAARSDVMRWGDWLAAGLLWLLALYGHYLAIFSLASVGLALVLAPATRRRWLPALVMAVIVGLAYLPWVLFVGSGLAGEMKDWVTGDALWRFLTAYSVGASDAGAPFVAQVVGAALLGALFIIGLAVLARRNVNTALWAGALALGTPFGVWLFALLRSAFHERFAIASVPAILLIAAAGVRALWGVRPAHGRTKRWGQWLGGAALAAWAGAALISLTHYYFDPRFAKSPPLREVMAYLAETARPGEVVVLHEPDAAFYYYYHSPTPIETAPFASLRLVSESEVAAQLARLRDNFQHIRFFFTTNAYFDPNDFVPQWLDECCEKTGDGFVYGYHVQTFDTPSGSLAAREPYAIDFEQGIRLTGFRVLEDDLRPGDRLHLTLYWQTDAPVAGSYTVFVHVLAPDGFQVAGADSLPDEGRRPTDQWLPGTDVIDPHDFALPADLPPGEYALRIGLYDLETGIRVRGTATGATGDEFTPPATVRVAVP